MEQDDIRNTGHFLRTVLLPLPPFQPSQLTPQIHGRSRHHPLPRVTSLPSSFPFLRPSLPPYRHYPAHFSSSLFSFLSLLPLCQSASSPSDLAPFLISLSPSLPPTLPPLSNSLSSSFLSLLPLCQSASSPIDLPSLNPFLPPSNTLALFLLPCFSPSHSHLLTF